MEGPRDRPAQTIFDFFFAKNTGFESKFPPKFCTFPDFLTEGGLCRPARDRPWRPLSKASFQKKGCDTENPHFDEKTAFSLQILGNRDFRRFFALKTGFLALFPDPARPA